MAEGEGASDQQLYQRHARPLEAEHWGEYIAIDPEGRTLVGQDRKELRKRADAQFGAGSVIFRIGPRVFRGFRWLRAVPAPPGTPVHPDDDSGNRMAVAEAAEWRAGLYAQYGQPLEPEHWGQYVAIQPDGATIVAGDYDALTVRARHELGLGSIIFKIGQANGATAVKPLEMILRYYD